MGKRNLYRDVQLNVRISAEENKQLHENMRKAGIKNKAAYVRKMILDGYVIHQDYAVLRECVVALARIGNNLNQLTKLANSYHDMNVPELRRLQKEVTEWRQRFLKELK